MWLFLGPQPLAGIGQVTSKYATLMQGEYVVFGERPKLNSYDALFVFALPLDDQIKMIQEFYKKLAPKMFVMTVCETDTVHPWYEKLFQLSRTIYCPSEFSRSNLARQFPQGEFKLLHHWTPIPKLLHSPDTTRPYIFYTIGNIMDPRKNIRALIEAFIRCGFPNAKLILKATCRQPVEWKFPNVEVINGLLPENELEKLHADCHCYVNCSHSEGVGMGAVEAALYDKPIIISAYGGLKEYVKTPYVIRCTKGPIGFDDFLFTKDLVWGHPDLNHLMELMKECYNKNITQWDHSFTRDLLGKVQGHICELST
jgi:glycosyltransferase involved in cell wall biosynthesis